MLTLWILAWGYNFIQNNLSVHLNRGFVWVLVQSQKNKGASKAVLDEYKAKLESTFVEGFAGSVVGFLIALLAIFLVGALLASVVGRALWRIVEAFLRSCWRRSPL